MTEGRQQFETPPKGKTRPAIFIDRDGVVIELVEYLNRPEQVVLIPGVADAMAGLNRIGIPVVMVTNQSAVARGLLTETGLAEVHGRLHALLAERGARIDGVYYCPHHPDFGEWPYRCACECRKPSPGMLLQAAEELGIDLSRSAFIGDNATDIEAGNRARVGHTILVRTGHGRAAEAVLAGSPYQPSIICPNVVSAIDAARDIIAQTEVAVPRG